nr:Flp1 family type IVb pilin [Anaerostipes caccae]
MKKTGAKFTSVLIGLVIIFQTQIKRVVQNIFKTITSKTGQVQ